MRIVSELIMKTNRFFKAGDVIYFAGSKGPAYKILEGSVRLDRGYVEHHQERFANLAVTGDLIGAEVLLSQYYAFDVRALTDCEIAVWQEPSLMWAEALASELIRSNQRKSDVVSLRCGLAMDRILRFIRLVGGNSSSTTQNNLCLPPLKETAEITDLTIETVSRCLTSLRKQGILRPVQGVKGNLRNRFYVSMSSVQFHLAAA